MAFFEYSALNQALKTSYSKLVDATIKDFPLLAMLKKESVKASGKTLNHTIEYSSGGIGTAGNLSQNAKFYESDAGTVECSLPWKRYYGYKSIDALQLELMEQSENSFIDGTAAAQEACTKQVMARASASICSRYPVTGPLFRLAASSATTYTAMVPLYASDLSKIEVGDQLSFDSVAVSSASAVVRKVTSIDRAGGTFAVETDSTGIADSDYVSKYGDQSATLSSTVSGNFMPGVFAWFPIPTSVGTRAVMTGDAYVFGCTRPVDYDRLCGWFYYGAGESSREEVILKALARGDRINGAKTTHICMNPADLAALLIESQGRLVITDNLVSARNEKGPIANVGFAGVQFATPTGIVKVFSDREMPIGVALAMNDQEIKLKLVNKEFPFIDDRGGSMWHPVEQVLSAAGTISYTGSLDRFQMIAKGYCTLAVKDPSQFGVIVLPTLSTY